MYIDCLHCSLPTKKKPSHVLSGRAKFCSKSCKSKYYGPTLMGVKNPFFGRKHSEESKNKMRIIKLGKRTSPETEFKKGDVPATWKGGRYTYLRNKCLERDDYTCVECSLSERQIMEVDHIVPVWKDKNLQYVLKNLRTLCPNCHARKSIKDKSIRYRLGIRLNP